MEQERIAERHDILYEVDEATCEGCGAPATPAAADDEAWFIDSVLVTDDANPDGYALAQIRCPKCW